MLKSKIFVTDQELVKLREKNLSKWKEEDFHFYEDFFDEISI